MPGPRLRSLCPRARGSDWKQVLAVVQAQAPGTLLAFSRKMSPEHQGRISREKAALSHRGWHFSFVRVFPFSGALLCACLYWKLNTPDPRPPTEGSLFWGEGMELYQQIQKNSISMCLSSTFKRIRCQSCLHFYPSRFLDV